MHEFSIMSQIVDTILSELEGRDVERVETVVLEVGELTFLGRDQLSFAFKVLTERNFLNGAEIDITVRKAEVKCPECGYVGGIEYNDEGHMSLPVLICPKCGARPNVTRGRECNISKVSVVLRDEEG